MALIGPFATRRSASLRALAIVERAEKSIAAGYRRAELTSALVGVAGAFIGFHVQAAQDVFVVGVEDGDYGQIRDRFRQVLAWMTMHSVKVDGDIVPLGTTVLDAIEDTALQRGADFIDRLLRIRRPGQRHVENPVLETCIGVAHLWRWNSAATAASP